MRRALTGCGLALLVSLGQTAQAQTPYELEAEVDGPITALGLVMALPALLEVAPPDCLPDACSDASINGLDRLVLGNYSQDAHTVADFTVLGLLTLPLLVDAIDDSEGWLTNTAIFAETLLVTQGLTQVVKLAVRRSAPFVFDESVPLSVRRDDPDAPRSFWSGHTATAASAMTAFTVLFWQQHPDSDWRWVVLGLGAVAVGTVGVLKIEAGYHYWTDIIAGAGAGVSFGLLIPLLHD